MSAGHKQTPSRKITPKKGPNFFLKMCGRVGSSRNAGALQAITGAATFVAQSAYRPCYNAGPGSRLAVLVRRRVKEGASDDDLHKETPQTDDQAQTDGDEGDENEIEGNCSDDHDNGDGQPGNDDDRSGPGGAAGGAGGNGSRGSGGQEGGKGRHKQNENGSSTSQTNENGADGAGVDKLSDDTTETETILRTMKWGLVPWYLYFLSFLFGLSSSLTCHLVGVFT